MMSGGTVEGCEQCFFSVEGVTRPPDHTGVLASPSEPSSAAPSLQPTSDERRFVAPTSLESRTRTNGTGDPPRRGLERLVGRRERSSWWPRRSGRTTITKIPRRQIRYGTQEFSAETCRSPLPNKIMARATRGRVGRRPTSRNPSFICLAIVGLRSRAKSSLLEADTRSRLAGNDDFILCPSCFWLSIQASPDRSRILGFAATVSK